MRYGEKRKTNKTRAFAEADKRSFSNMLEVLITEAAKPEEAREHFAIMPPLSGGG